MHQAQASVTLEDLRQALIEFDQNHPRPVIGHTVNLLQILVLEEGKYGSYWDKGAFLNIYADEPCVYMFFDQIGQLIYIGQTKVLGNRFGKHFSKEGLGMTHAKSLALLPLPRECWFEILAIEAYLIERLRPLHNKR
jgi:hypothetical protein